MGIEDICAPGILVEDRPGQVVEGTITAMYGGGLMMVDGYIPVRMESLLDGAKQDPKIGRRICVHIRWVKNVPCHAIWAEMIPEKPAMDAYMFESSFGTKVVCEKIRVGQISVKDHDAGIVEIQGFTCLFGELLPDFEPSNYAVGDWVRFTVNESKIEDVQHNREAQICGKLRWKTFSLCGDPEKGMVGNIAHCSHEWTPELLKVKSGSNVFVNAVEWSDLPRTPGERRMRSHCGWRTVKAVQQDECVVDLQDGVKLKGQFYWMLPGRNHTESHRFEILTSDQSLISLAIEPEQNSVFRRLGNRQPEVDEKTRHHCFEIVCDSSNASSSDNAVLKISIGDQEHEFNLMRQGDCSFAHGILETTSYGPALTLWREFDECRVAPDGRPNKYASSLPKAVKGYKRGYAQFNPPKRMKDIYSNSPPNSLLNDLLAEFVDLCNPPNPRSYLNKFRCLLYLEHIGGELKSFQMKPMAAKFDVEDMCLVFDWPYDDDNMLSVIVGDKIIVNDQQEGQVVNLESGRVFVHFSKEFHDNYRPGTVCYIRFMSNPATLRRCLDVMHSIGQSNVPSDIFFPNCDKSEIDNVPSFPELAWFNDQLNPEQKLAVNGILNKKRYCNHPFILFGPPGTGKTVTIVEAIRQAYHTSSSSKVLACAPSNAAADIIASKLIATDAYRPSCLGRLYAHSRSIDQIPEDIFPFASVMFASQDGRDGFLGRRIIITTFSTASMLRFTNGTLCRFTHVFLDECAQAIEPEALIPVYLAERMAGTPCITLAGDPFQLGPVLWSNEAKRLGLLVPMLERLLRSRIVISSNSQSICLVKLVRTYRYAHQALIHVPSLLFYDSELIPVLNTACMAETGMPPSVEFKDNADGKCERDPESGSCYNEKEATVVAQLVMKYVLNDKVPPSSIGIITPYRKQIQKIRNILNELKDMMLEHSISEIKIGSVEEFQGTERNVILVSTVRTLLASHGQSNVASVKDRQDDGPQSSMLGFLVDPKRLNVSLTRAKLNLVVIGNKNALMTNYHWKHFIEYAMSKPCHQSVC